MELAIISLLSIAENHSKYMRFIAKHLVTRETYTILIDLKEWFKTNDDVVWADFSTWFRIVKHSGMKAEQLDLYSAIFTKMDSFEPTETDEEIMNALVMREYAARIAESAGNIADGVKGELLDIDMLMSEYRVHADIVSKTDSMFVTEDIDEIMTAVIPSKECLRWRLKELNISLGPLRVGDFITLGARPDSGKTTMLASEVSNMAAQLKHQDKTVYWFCNEESGKRVKFRIMQAALGIKTKDFVSDIEKYYAAYLATVGGERIKLIHSASMSCYDVETVVKNRDDVGLIVFDQLHKFQGVVGGKDTNEVGKQGLLFAWARGIAEYAPVINVHQVKGTGEGVMYPEMDQLYGSTTIIQGECDAIVMLGRPHDPEFSDNTRGLYAPKNKLVGELTSDGRYRNAQFEIEIQPDLARFKGAH